MAQSGEFLLAHGGTRLAQNLVASGRVDEYRLAVHPAVLSRGLPLFRDLASPVQLRVISATLVSSGIFAGVYQPE